MLRTKHVGYPREVVVTDHSMTSKDATAVQNGRKPPGSLKLDSHTNV